MMVSAELIIAAKSKINPAPMYFAGIKKVKPSAKAFLAAVNRVAMGRQPRLHPQQL